MTDRSRQLEALIQSLRRLQQLLLRDPRCLWTRGISSFLQEAEHLRSSGFTQDDLNLLSGSVMGIYAGMGSFSDYIPQQDGHFLPWVEEFDRLRGEVHCHALMLRVSGNT